MATFIAELHAQRFHRVTLPFHSVANPHVKSRTATASVLPPDQKSFLWSKHINLSHTTVASPQEPARAPKLDLLQGTLDLMVLQTLATVGAQHGYGIARRIEQVLGDSVLLNQGTIYASLIRLQQRGWISAEWGTSRMLAFSKARFAWSSHSTTSPGTERSGQEPGRSA